MYRILLATSILCSMASSAVCQAIEKGVSATLATQRHAAISKLSYRLSFNIPPDKSAKIACSETIDFTLRDAQQPLQLDFRQDNSYLQSVSVNGRATTVNLQEEHLVIDKQFLLKGHNSIGINFTAGNESLNRNADYLYALFVPDRARTVFPCFDQPDLKAIFILSLTVPSRWAVLANSAIRDSTQNGATTTYHFKPSDPLPTYLFSFTAGRYTVADKAGMRFLYRETDSAKIRLSVDSIFNAHTDAIRFLEDWTGIKFPFQKIGFAGIPSFQFGGMEHPGEVQYNAGALFLDEGATRDQQIARSNVISHETAHMWFGDMVTMKWFDDVWMKEVFANFMADKVTEKMLGRETFDLKFLLNHTPAAFNVDRTAGANPIRQRLDNLQQAGSLYGNIIYHKAPIMMRQLELLIGKDNFRKGLQEYLQHYKYGNARWDDLIAILSRHTTIDLRAWNKVWVNRPGRPVFDYQYIDKNLLINQHPETGDAAFWPEHFAVTLFYPGSSKTLDIDLRQPTVLIPLPQQPTHILFNSDGIGYGLFPAQADSQLYHLASPLQRASAYINAYESMLAGRGVTAAELLDFLLQGVQKETNELNLRLICGYIVHVYWQFMSSAQRSTASSRMEQTLWSAMATQKTANNKKIIFNTYVDIYASTEAGNRVFAIWHDQKAPGSVKLTEDDYTSLALVIALKTDTVNNVLRQQLARISNPDRKARLEFLMPALSPDSAERDKFFTSLREPGNRRKEAWVSAGLAYMNHPLRQRTFIKFLPATLDMLEDIQRTGDIFFPQNWLAAIFSNYQSAEVWQLVEHFLLSHPGYNVKLKEKILQATDNLHRAQQVAAIK